MEAIIQTLHLKIVHHSLHVRQIEDVFIDEASDIYIAMTMYNLIEQSDIYSGITGSLWQFKRDNNPVNNADLTVDNSQSFKCKTALVGKTQMLLIIQIAL